MRNLVQHGKSINITLTAPINSGDALQIGDMLGVASVDGAIGDNIAFAVKKVYRLPKTAADVIVAGAVVNFDASAGAAGEITIAATAAAGDVTNCGRAHEDAGNGVASIAVSLNTGDGLGS